MVQSQSNLHHVESSSKGPLLRRSLTTSRTLLLVIFVGCVASSTLCVSSFMSLELKLDDANAKLNDANLKLFEASTKLAQLNEKTTKELGVVRTPNDLKAEHLRLDRLASHRICVIVRTHPGQANLLPITLLSLTQQEYKKPDVSLSVFVVNTDSKGYEETAFMDEAAADANLRAGRTAVTVLDGSIDGEPPDSATYGYDVTDHVLEDLLATTNCTHFSFANGDSFYSVSLVKWIAPSLRAGKQLIAWDFLTRYNRNYNVVKVKFQVDFLDLGSVVVDRRAIEAAPRTRFLPNGKETKKIKRRDFFFFDSIFRKVGNETVHIVKQVLFVHQ